jgi:pilus assembly protein CpaB
MLVSKRPQPRSAPNEFRMKPARIMILTAALIAGLGAAWLVAGSKPSAPLRELAIAPVATPMDKVLVAAKNIPFGGTIQANDLRWQSWPKGSIPPGVVLHAADPNAIDDLKGALTRDPIAPGEPVYANRLIHPGNASFMAAILPAGTRAVAINIDSQGATTAGGFILPNDHVDVIHTYKDQAAAGNGTDGMVSETILRNVRILAIGQNIQQQGDQRVVVGSNATLELTPSQAEKIVLAQRTGQLSLSLRSMADTSTTATHPQSPATPPT